MTTQIKAQIKGCKGTWFLVQRPSGKWAADMPFSFLDEFDSPAAALENAKIKNPTYFTA